MTQFLKGWARAAQTTIGFFWMALWAFALGYVISSMIQVFVTRERMQRTMGAAGARSVGLPALPLLGRPLVAGRRSDRHAPDRLIPP